MVPVMKDILLLLTIVIVISSVVHFWLLQVRRLILAEIKQVAPLGKVELWVGATNNGRLRLPIFAQKRYFFAEVIFAERSIFIFKIYKLGPLQLYADIFCLVKQSEDIPRIQDLWFSIKMATYHKINSILIDGNRVVVECSWEARQKRWGMRMKFYESKFLISDLRDSDAHKNLHYLDHYIHQKTNLLQK